MARLILMALSALVGGLLALVVTCTACSSTQVGESSGPNTAIQYKTQDTPSIEQNRQGTGEPEAAK